ncbi:peptide-methionine (S)-S-oxide reductase MsrA [Candidatus Woesearchaeota archaeon]|nr:peptide-methionine (S)-S-oxide reductase MsrA [Candidatus Woesearchaeota archaeon]
MEKATFGAGCFWHLEETLRNSKGVIRTTVGYEGGKIKNPSYEQVCTNKTGHIEVVELDFDPKIISYKKFLEIFWEEHDPASMDRQGPDAGAQYRSVIFYHTEEQKEQAMQSKEAWEKKHKKKIVTKILPAETFYKAEEYHQKYLMKRGLRTCPI